MFAQNDILNDSISSRGKIIQKLKRESIAPISFTSNSNKNKIQGFRLCDHFYLDIQALNKELSKEDIETLFNSDNGALKAVSFILFAIRNNEKELVINKLNEVIKQDFTLMTKNCSDAISTISLARFNYKLLLEPFFYKANFKLSRKEKQIIEIELRKNELYY
jgi:hypothetical protein